jgi:adenylate cyclase
MSSQKAERKLCAVLSADVAGYSRLMGEDELATIETLQTCQEMFTASIEQFRGRVIGMPGDNILAEFASVVDAVECAVSFQKQLKNLNAELPEHRRMNFRIGINVGEVIEDNGLFYGDAVNVAARLENLADEGGICISGTVHDQLEPKLPLAYQYLGKKRVKNIRTPLRVYRILMETPGREKPAGQRRFRWKSSARWALVMFVIVGIASLAWWKFPLGKGAEATKASIVVLPFKNLSDDPEQDYFSDGITNDIITDLSRFRDVFVVASNTAFAYKNKPVKIKDLARKLHVDYVLEGSVQKVGNQARINVQLIDARDERHLWAERYDRQMEDLLTLQDEIIKKIVVRLAIKIGEVERTRASRGETGNFKAYDCKLRGMDCLLRQTPGSNQEARKFFEKAIELDPDYALAYTGLARTYLADFSNGWTKSPEFSLQKALEFAHKAVSIDGSLASAHAVLGEVYNRRQQPELAVAELQRAIHLNLNDTESYGLLGKVMLYQGKTAKAINLLESAIHIDPNAAPDTFMYLGLGYYLTEQYTKAVNLLNQEIARRPG